MQPPQDNPHVASQWPADAPRQRTRRREVREALERNAKDLFAPDTKGRILVQAAEIDGQGNESCFQHAYKCRLTDEQGLGHNRCFGAPVTSTHILMYGWPHTNYFLYQFDKLRICANVQFV